MERAVNHAPRGDQPQRPSLTCKVPLGRSGGLGWVQRLYLALLIHAQNDRLIRRVQIEPHDVTHLGGEFWRRLDVCRSSCRTFLNPVELRWRRRRPEVSQTAQIVSLERYTVHICRKF